MRNGTRKMIQKNIKFDFSEDGKTIKEIMKSFKNSLNFYLFNWIERK